MIERPKSSYIGKSESFMDQKDDGSNSKQKNDEKIIKNKSMIVLPEKEREKLKKLIEMHKNQVK